MLLAELGEAARAPGRTRRRPSRASRRPRRTRWPTPSGPGSPTSRRQLAEFERLLGHARRIGRLTETHNYWIDRMAQARLRTLAMRVGARLVREGVIERPDDVLYLRRAEVPGASAAQPRTAARSSRIGRPSTHAGSVSSRRRPRRADRRGARPAASAVSGSPRRTTRSFAAPARRPGSSAARPGSSSARTTSGASGRATSSSRRRRTRRGCRCSRSPAASSRTPAACSRTRRSSPVSSPCRRSSGPAMRRRGSPTGRLLELDGTTGYVRLL